MPDCPRKSGAMRRSNAEFAATVRARHRALRDQLADRLRTTGEHLPPSMSRSAAVDAHEPDEAALAEVLLTALIGYAALVATTALRATFTPAAVARRRAHIVAAALYLNTLKTPEVYADEPAEAVTRFCGRFLQLLVWEPQVRTCRLRIAADERLPGSSNAYFDAMFVTTHERLSVYRMERYEMGRESTATLARDLLDRVVLPGCCARCSTSRRRSSTLPRRWHWPKTSIWPRSAHWSRRPCPPRRDRLVSVLAPPAFPGPNAGRSRTVGCRHLCWGGT